MKISVARSARPAPLVFCARWFGVVTIVVLSPAVLRAAILYECDWSTGRLNRFAEDGTKTVFATGLANPAGLAFDANGVLYEADQGSGTIYKFAPSGARRVFSTAVRQPSGLAFDRDGNLFVADTQGRSVHKITPEGEESVFATGFLNPLGLAFDTAGNLYVANFDRINRITPQGVVSTFAGAPFGIVGLAFSSSGNLFTTDGQSEVWRYSPSGERTLFGLVGGGQSSSIAFAPDGTLFVGDRGRFALGAGTIYTFTPAGVRSTFATGLDDPQHGLAFAPVPEPSTVTTVALVALACRRRCARLRG